MEDTKKHKSALRFPGDCLGGFPNLETVIFVVLDQEVGVIIAECFTRKDDGELKTFTFKGGHWFVGDNDMGELLYASGIDGLAEFLMKLATHCNRKFVFAPARGGRLESVL
jgi:hypothetical protein